MERHPCVYILASRPRGTLYIGVTSDPLKRVYEHRAGERRGFTTRYSIKRLVHFEMFDDMEHAIAREKQLKRWHRPWKISLIEQANPEWRDLAEDWGFEPLGPETRQRQRRMDAETSSA